MPQAHGACMAGAAPLLHAAPDALELHGEMGSLTELLMEGLDLGQVCVGRGVACERAEITDAHIRACACARMCACASSSLRRLPPPPPSAHTCQCSSWRPSKNCHRTPPAPPQPPLHHSSRSRRNHPGEKVCRREGACILHAFCMHPHACNCQGRGHAGRKLPRWHRDNRTGSLLRPTQQGAGKIRCTDAESPAHFV